MPATQTSQEKVPRQEVPESAVFSLAALVEEISVPVSERARTRGIAFRTFIAREVPPTLSGDPARLRQVLENLLNNAVRFTVTGEVRIDIRSVAEPGESPESGSLLRFTVIDTGIGIERTACAGIFDGDRLAASRRMVQRMGGDLHFHSTPGEGATFWFMLLFGAARAPETPELKPAAARTLRILIAEDNTVNQLILAEQISTMGHVSMTVPNGREALEAVERSVWDAILLDCQMPVMNGYETVAALRDREAAGAPRTWTVAITANALGGEREACLRAGMDDFLSKPIRFRELAEVIARIPSPPDSPNPPVSDAKLADLAKAKSSTGENLLDRMTALFTQSGPQILDEMDQALAAEDFAEAVRAAHKLGGGCGYFGASELRALCSEAERLGHAGNQAGIRAIAPRIRKEYDRVEAALRRSQGVA